MALVDRRCPPPPARRRSADRAAFQVLLTWAAAAATVLFVAAETSVGPVVMSLSKGHGIHLGDVAALIVAVAVALMITAWIVVRNARR